MHNFESGKVVPSTVLLMLSSNGVSGFWWVPVSSCQWLFTQFWCSQRRWVRILLLCLLELFLFRYYQIETLASLKRFRSLLPEPLLFTQTIISYWVTHFLPSGSYFKLEQARICPAPLCQQSDEFFEGEFPHLVERVTEKNAWTLLLLALTYGAH